MEAFVVLAVLVGGAIGVLCAIAESNKTPEQRERDAQLRHHQQLMNAELEHAKRLHEQQNKSQVKGAVTKAAVGLAISLLTGGNHRHR